MSDMAHMTDERLEELISELHGRRRVRVLFVCLGNICRSPAAEGVMATIVDDNDDNERWELDSAGTGNWHVGQLPDRRMRIHARQRGIELTHRCRQVQTDDFEYFDLIIPMDNANLADLRELAPDPESEHKIVPMAAFLSPSSRYDHVPDPYYEGAEGFELVLDLLQDGCQNLYNRIRKN